MNNGWYILLSFVFVLLIGWIIGIKMAYNKLTPTAMDVYQGKTTLEITYKDNVAIDSIVVYKN